MITYKEQKRIKTRFSFNIIRATKRFINFNA